MESASTFRSARATTHALPVTGSDQARDWKQIPIHAVRDKIAGRQLINLLSTPAWAESMPPSAPATVLQSVQLQAEREGPRHTSKHPRDARDTRSSGSGAPRQAPGSVLRQVQLQSESIPAVTPFAPRSA